MLACRAGKPGGLQCLSISLPLPAIQTARASGRPSPHSAAYYCFSRFNATSLLWWSYHRDPAMGIGGQALSKQPCSAVERGSALLPSMTCTHPPWLDIPLSFELTIILLPGLPAFAAAPIAQALHIDEFRGLLTACLKHAVDQGLQPAINVRGRPEMRQGRG